MAHQVVRPGHPLDFLTPHEMAAMLPKPRQVTRVRSPQTIQLDSNGNGVNNVYECPLGYKFEARRIVLSLTGNAASDPTVGAVAIAAGHWVAYLRSGNLIEYGQPQWTTLYQVPGVQTWGDEQGPFIRNGEVFQVQAGGLGANATLNVYLEGILTRPGGEDA